MNIYSVIELENKIDRFAEAHDGEIPDALYEELVAEQIKSVAQIESLVKYIKNLDLGIDMCDAEIARISEMKAKANNRIAGIKKYLTPFIANRGKTQAGTFTLSTRKSEKVIIDDENKIPSLYTVIKQTSTIDKNMIKQVIKNGMVIDGVHLETKDNLQIK